MPLQRFLIRYSVPLLFLLGILLRLEDLKRPFLGIYAWNEAYYSIIAVNFTHYGWWQQWGPDGPLFTSNPLVPWVIAVCFHRFGIHEWAGRLPFFLSGLVSMAAVYGIAKLVYPRHPAVARWTLLFAATMPGIVFFSRNIQLDGPMTAAGLLGIWLAAVFAQRKNGFVLVCSIAAMALCVAFKYTGILAFPAWWIALGLRRSDWKRGLLLSLAALVPAVFAIHWMSAQQGASHLTVSGLTTKAYFLRFDEWRVGAFAQAFVAVWRTLPTHWGNFLFYPFLVALPFLIGRITPERLFRHRLILALILPWYLQIIYPVSWVVNEYYDYFALYGVALGMGALASWVAEAIRESRTPLHMPRWSVAFAVMVVIISNIWDYHQTFHQSYFPYDIIPQQSPYFAAKTVRSLDRDNSDIITDQSETMFYANPNPAVTKYLWWHDNLAALNRQINSRQPKYVVFEYLPDPSTVQALDSSGYQVLVPGAWVRGGSKPSTR